MPWDTDTSATGGNVLSFVYTSAGASTMVGTRYMITNVYGTASDYTTVLGYSNGGGFYDTGITYGSGGNTVGFHSDQVRQVREDYDAVKQDWKRRRAEVKARRLFQRVVGERAYKLFRKKGYHEIVGATHRRYRLRPGRWVQVMKDDGKADHQLCAHLAFGIPWFDTMVVQHLMLTSSEETEKRFLKLANVHGVEGPYPIPEMDVAA